MEDTICAIATSLGVGAISIIRLSGKDAIEKVNSIFSRDLTNVNSHSVTYGHIVYKNEIIDEVLVTVMRAPKTYTTEDIVEINSHGGYVTSNKILEILLEIGCKLAEPGEFTKRAFLNGIIDLSQAEAVMDIITAKTELSMKSAMAQSQGVLSKEINRLREQALNALTLIEYAVDFTEDDEEPDEQIPINVKKQVEDLIIEIENLLSTADEGKIIKDGLSMVIVGKPNVGKSSLLNVLLRQKRAIVTEIAGTTRDVIEEYINLDGVPIRIVDTAGIRETEDVVEKIGVEKSKEKINEADLIVFMLDTSRELDEEDKEIINYIKNILYNDAKFNMEYCDITGPYKERLESQGSDYKEDSLDLADAIKSNEEVNKYLYIPYKEDGEYEIEFDNHFDDVSIEIFVENKNIN